MNEREEPPMPHQIEYPDEIMGDIAAKKVFTDSVLGIKRVLSENFPEAQWRREIQNRVVGGISELTQKYSRGEDNPEEAKKYWRKTVFKEAVFPFRVNEDLAERILSNWEEGMPKKE